MTGIALLLPPGWTLHPGGPHIGLPLLKGFLEKHGIETKVYDLNIGSTKYHGVHVGEDQVEAACSAASLPEMNIVYFEAEDRLQAVAQKYGGTWYAHEGYRRTDCNIATPEDIRKFSQEESPFTDYLTKKAIPEILKTDPKLIGISITVPTQILQTFEVVRLLRKAGYKGFIVLGGNVVTRIYDDMSLTWVFDLIDGFVHLQGEQTLLQIYNNLGDPLKMAMVPNLTWKDGDTVRRNPPELLKPVDFAPPDFSDIEVSDYWGTNYLTMVGARGCYYGKCTFCAIPYGFGPRGYIGSSPAMNVYQSMRSCYDQKGINRFKFIDEALHPKMLQNLVTIIEENPFDCQFEAYFRLEQSWLQPGFLKRAAKAGLRKVYLGLELIPSDGRDLLSKSDGADPVQLLNALQEAGIKAHVFCMFGFPGTGVKEAFNTIDFALNNDSLIDTLDVFPFYYARHTKVEGVTIKPAPYSTWNVEHQYEPARSDVLPPSQVTILAEKLGEVVWSEHPEWLHPVYRMYSPWY